jgi:hypothetical protein
MKVLDNDTTTHILTIGIAYTTSKKNSKIKETSHIHINQEKQKKLYMISKEKITNVLCGVWGNAYISTQIIPRMTCECFDIF